MKLSDNIKRKDVISLSDSHITEEMLSKTGAIKDLLQSIIEEKKSEDSIHFDFFFDKLKTIPPIIPKEKIFSSSLPLCPIFPKIRGITCDKIAENIESMVKSRLLLLKKDFLQFYKPELFDESKNSKRLITTHDVPLKQKYYIDLFSKAMFMDMNDVEDAAKELSQKVKSFLLKNGIDESSTYIITSPVGGLFWTGALMRALNLKKSSLLQNYFDKEQFRLREMVINFESSVPMIPKKVDALHYFYSMSPNYIIPVLQEIIDKIGEAKKEGKNTDDIIEDINNAMKRIDLGTHKFASFSLRPDRILEEDMNLFLVYKKLFNEAYYHVNFSSYDSTLDELQNYFLDIAESLMREYNPTSSENLKKSILLSVKNGVKDSVNQVMKEHYRYKKVTNLKDINNYDWVTFAKKIKDMNPFTDNKEKLLIIADDIVESGQQYLRMLKNFMRFIGSNDKWHVLPVHIVNRKGRMDNALLEYIKDYHDTNNPIINVYGENVTENFKRLAYESINNAIYYRLQMSPIDPYDYTDVKKWEDDDVVSMVIFPWGTTDSSLNNILVEKFIGDRYRPRIYEFMFSRTTEVDAGRKRRIILS